MSSPVTYRCRFCDVLVQFESHRYCGAGVCPSHIAAAIAHATEPTAEEQLSMDAAAFLFEAMEDAANFRKQRSATAA